MFSKQEASQLKKDFWTAFGQYMKPVPSAEGEKVNWLNYRTGEKGIQFKMDADGKSARIGIEISHADLGIQQLYFQQFQQLQKMLESTLGEQWDWSLHESDAFGKTVSSISTRLLAVNIINRDHWPRLISFFKPRMIALDQFWSSARYGFESLH